jgi:putative oxidoreductase
VQLPEHEQRLRQFGFPLLNLADMARLCATEPGNVLGPAHVSLNTTGCWQARGEMMKANALLHFILSGNRSLKEFAVVLSRFLLGAFFAISGGNKIFVASQYKIMYETIVGAGIPFPHVMTYFVSSVEFVCGCLLIIGLLSTFCCVVFIIDMIVAITTVQLATIPKALSVMDWLDDFLYFPEVMYIVIFFWLISSGSGRLSIDHWIAVRSGLLDGVSADHSDTQAVSN